MVKFKQIHMCKCFIWNQNFKNSKGSIQLEKNPFGFILIITLESCWVWLGFSFTACLVTFGVGYYLIEIAINKTTKRSLIHINHIVRRKRSRMHLMKQFSKYIQYNSEEKQYVKVIHRPILIDNFKSDFLFSFLV